MSRRSVSPSTVSTNSRRRSGLGAQSRYSGGSKAGYRFMKPRYRPEGVTTKKRRGSREARVHSPTPPRVVTRNPSRLAPPRLSPLRSHTWYIRPVPPGVTLKSVRSGKSFGRPGSGGGRAPGWRMGGSRSDEDGARLHRCVAHVRRSADITGSARSEGEPRCRGSALGPEPRGRARKAPTTRPVSQNPGVRPSRQPGSPRAAELAVSTRWWPFASWRR